MQPQGLIKRNRKSKKALPPSIKTSLVSVSWNVVPGLPESKSSKNLFLKKSDFWTVSQSPIMGPWKLHLSTPDNSLED